MCRYSPEAIANPARLPRLGGCPRLPPSRSSTSSSGTAGRLAVDGLTLTVAAGVVTAVLGPNGAGKTTTVETCEGYRRPDAGTVRVLGLDPGGTPGSCGPGSA